MPVEHLLAVDHALINKHRQICLSQVVSLVAHCHKLPLVGGFTKGVTYVHYRVVQVDSQKSVGKGESKSIVN